MKPDRLKDFQESYTKARTTLRDIHYLANAFAVTGNTQVASDLRAISEELEESVKAMDNAVTGMIHDDFNDSQRAVGETLRCLLGVTDDTN